MNQANFDVIVAGGGVGGAAAAFFLKQAGLTTLVIEKAQYPRYKACGGAIPRQTLDRFPFDFTGIIQAAPAHARLAYADLPAIDVPLPGRPVAMVMRSEFDAFLLAHSGAEVLEGTTVTDVIEHKDAVEIKTGDRRITARYLVGADGATSTIARCLGLRKDRYLGGTLEAEVPIQGSSRLREEYGDRAVFSLAAVDWGYAWVFPKGDLLSVGIGRFRTGRVSLLQALQCEMTRFGIPLEGVKIHGHPLPCYQARPWPFWRGQPQEPISTRRCLLVGDAAGLVDPLLGEGIRYAITSARIAAEAIVRDDISNYERTIWQEISHSLATAGLVANLFYRFPRQSFQIGLGNSAIVRLFSDLLAEKHSYEGIGRRVVAEVARSIIRGKRASSGL